MAWLLYELSRNPEVQARVREEIAIAKAKAHGTLTWDDYNGMVWLEAVIKVQHRFNLSRN